MTESTEDTSRTAAELRYAIIRLARRLRCARAGETSDAQIAILVGLRNHGRHTLSRLAERERVTPPTMSKTVDGLVELGLVTRTPDEDDRRRVYIEITPAGEDVLVETSRRRDALLAEMIDAAQFDEHQLAVLSEAATLLGELVEP